jgi:hypothetical protein
MIKSFTSRFSINNKNRNVMKLFSSKSSETDPFKGKIFYFNKFRGGKNEKNQENRKDVSFAEENIEKEKREMPSTNNFKREENEKNFNKKSFSKINVLNGTKYSEDKDLQELEEFRKTEERNKFSEEILKNHSNTKQMNESKPRQISYLEYNVTNTDQNFNDTKYKNSDPTLFSVMEEDSKQNILKMSNTSKNTEKIKSRKKNEQNIEFKIKSDTFGEQAENIINILLKNTTEEVPINTKYEIKDFNFGEKERKLITLKSNTSEADEFNYEEINYGQSTPQIKKPVLNREKWQRFFKKNVRPLLDLDRAIKNPVSSKYLDFYGDYKKRFQDDQLLLAFKNIILGDRYNIQDLSVIKDYIMKGVMNLASKRVLLSFCEIFYLNFYHINNTNIYVMASIIPKIVPYLKMYSNEFKLAEILLVLNVMLIKNEAYDIYLVNSFFENFTPKDFQEAFLCEKNYKILYFGNEANLSGTIFVIFDTYIKFIKSCKGLLNMEHVGIIKETLKNFMDLLSNDTINIKILQLYDIDFSNIISIFDMNEGIKLERDFNNLLIEKINQEISKFYPENKNSILSSDLQFYSQLLTNVMPNYDNKLMQSVFNSLCELFYVKLQETEISQFLEKSNQKNCSYSNLYSILYFGIMYNLMRTMVNCNLSNNHLIDYYFIFLEFEIHNEMGWYSITRETQYYSKLLSFIGKYNFDETFKKNKQNPQTVFIYFKILLKMEEKVEKNISKYLSSLRSNEHNFDNKLSVSREALDINQEFYKNFFGAQHVEESIMSWSLEKDLVLDQSTQYYLNRFNDIPNSYNMLTYFDKSIFYHPQAEYFTSLKAYGLIQRFESCIDYFIALINTKLVKNRHVDLFLELLNEINIKSFGSGSLYETVFKEVILSNFNTYKKLCLIIDFIFHPNNYYNPYENSSDSNSESNAIETFLNFFKNHYNFEKYQIWENYDTPRNLCFSEFFEHTGTRFLKSLNNLYTPSNEEEKQDLEEYICNYYKSFSNSIHSRISSLQYDSSHQHFMQIYWQSQPQDFYVNPKLFGIFSIEELKNFNEENDSQNNLYKNSISLHKIKIDLVKITQTLEKSILLKSSIDDIIDEVSEFYEKKDHENNYENVLRHDFSLSKNFSKINVKEILNSKIYFDYCREYIFYMLESSSKDSKMKTDIDKNIDKGIKYYPAAPYFSYFFTKSNLTENEEPLKLSDNKNSLVILNEKYLQSNIINQFKMFEISFLKSQYENLMIIE